MFRCLELERGKNAVVCVCACVCVCVCVKALNSMWLHSPGKLWLPREGGWTVEIGEKGILCGLEKRVAFQLKRLTVKY